MKNVSDAEVRSQIGAFFQSRDFALLNANLGKPADQQATLADWKKVAMSLPRLYAVVEAAEIAIALGVSPDLASALKTMASEGTDAEPTSKIGQIAARLAWQSQQPLLGEERLDRPIMGCTSGSLPPGELEKDIVRIRATAQLVLDHCLA
ncbi:MAG: hypothetical protein WC250_02900 [Candidatus Paceibacterota bacterium]|jgi:hypothetical protein